MAGAIRFTTAELADLEARIAGAGERALAIELAVFDELAAEVAAAADRLRAIGEALAVLDVAAALAVLAEAENYCRPVVDDFARLHDRRRPPPGGRAGAARRAPALRRQ